MKFPQILTPQILSGITSRLQDNNPWWDVYVTDNKAFNEQMRKRPIRQAMEEGSYTVLGKAKDGFVATVEDCEGCCIIVNGLGTENWQKHDSDYGGSLIHIYIEDGEVRAI